MKKRVGFVALGLMLMLAGCGSSNAETEFVQVEIEKIEDIKTPVVEELSTEDSVAGDSYNEEVADAEEEIPVAEESENSEEVLQETNSEEAQQETEEVNVDYEKDASSLYVVVVGNTSEEILELAKEELSWQSVNLEIVQVSSFDQANELVASGQADASLCVNKAFMDSYNTIHNSNLIIARREYYEPLAIFPGKSSSLGKCNNGAVIAVPEGSISVARALYLLEQKGVIKIKDGASYQACADDITSNPHNIKIETYDLTAGKPDTGKYDYIVMDFNHAIVYGIDSKSAFGYENRNSKLLDMFTVNLVTKNGNEDDSKLQKLIKVLDSNSISSYISSTYAGAVVDY